MQCFISLSFVKKLSVFWLSDYESMYVHVCMCNRVCTYICVLCCAYIVMYIIVYHNFVKFYIRKFSENTDQCPLTVQSPITLSSR